ncbi:ABC transporter permease/substrate-binding protein [Bacillus pumilus]|uniref:ABC transporter permease/substrate-binding protein n=1 Tax=Bacillus pumilus TaxID=1408 RepID=UPI003F4282F7
MNDWINVLLDRKEQLGHALLEHIQISFIALFLAILIAIPLGIYLTRVPKLAEWVIGVTAVLQTIPSLALLGLLIPLVGIGQVPAIIALVVYALLPILRNTYTGIQEVDPSLREAALAMGMNHRKRLLKVELPLAMPVIMAGIRTGMVLIVGTATLAALIGAGGLGSLILLGIDRNDMALIVIGAIPAALLALLFDVVLRTFERISFKKTVISVTVFAVIAGAIVAGPSLFQQEKKEITIGGKLGSEPEILISMYKLLIEQDTDIQVNLKPGLGKTSFVFQALRSGDIDIYPEFTGTVISEFLKQTAKSTDKEKVYEQARRGLESSFQLRLLEPMAYNNTYALAVPQSLADQYDVSNISDLGKIKNRIKAGFTLEFSDRQDGYRGIQKTYQFSFDDVVTMEPKLRYRAIQKGDINLVDAYSTDSELRQYKLKVLNDDQHVFPPYQGAPLLRQETLTEYPEIETSLNKLGGQITDDEMREMNYEVNVQGKDAFQVAKAYLKKKKLLH